MEDMVNAGKRRRREGQEGGRKKGSGQGKR